MSLHRPAFALFSALIFSAGPLPLLAQDVDVDELEEDDFADDVAEAQAIEIPVERQVAEEKAALAEVVRGGYVQAMLTDTLFLGSTYLTDDAGNTYQSIGAYSNWGLGLKMALGYEVVESASFSGAIEFAYAQGAFNAAGPDQFFDSPVQGDFRTHMFQAAFKPTLIVGRARRISIVGKVGGGVVYSGQTVSDVYVPPTGAHGTPHPFGGAGLGLEYYSKLSHFSVMLVEAEYLNIIGFDAALALNFVGVKYTF